MSEVTAGLWGPDVTARGHGLQLGLNVTSDTICQRLLDLKQMLQQYHLLPDQLHLILSLVFLFLHLCLYGL